MGLPKAECLLVWDLGVVFGGTGVLSMLSPGLAKSEGTRPPGSRAVMPTVLSLCERPLAGTGV
jgi:hypothetical protein